MPLVRAALGFAPAFSSTSTMRTLAFSDANESGVTP